MTDRRRFAPIPLRAFLGGGLMLHGGIKLFAAGGHANIAYGHRVLTGAEQCGHQQHLRHGCRLEL